MILVNQGIGFSIQQNMENCIDNLTGQIMRFLQSLTAGWVLF